MTGKLEFDTNPGKQNKRKFAAYSVERLTEAPREEIEAAIKTSLPVFPNTIDHS